MMSVNWHGWPPQVYDGKKWVYVKLDAKAANMTSYLINTRTKRKFEIIALDKSKNLLTLRGETGGIFEEPYDKPRLKELGYVYVQQDTQQDA